MKKGIAFILLLLFSLQTFYAGLFTAWFMINRQYVAETLCVNKNKPMLKCHGKCYLSKKLKQAEQQEEQNLPFSSKQSTETTPCIITEINIHFSATACLKTIYSTAPENHYTHAYNRAIFRPPCTIS